MSRRVKISVLSVLSFFLILSYSYYQKENRMITISVEYYEEMYVDYLYKYSISNAYCVTPYAKIHIVETKIKEVERIKRDGNVKRVTIEIE